jgi:hypothetical protein
MCGQALRRRRPRVLGEEHRPGARMLPIERALHERLHGTPARGRKQRYAPPPWAEAYRANTVAATVTIERQAAAGGGDTNRGGVATLTAPPAPFDVETLAAPTAPPPYVEEPTPIDIQSYLSSFEPHGDDVMLDERVDAPTPDATRALADDGFVAPPPVDVTPPAPVYVEPEPAYEIEPGPLDPEVQALVDDLYRKARAEIVGSFDGMESELVPEVPAYEEPTHEQPPTDAPRRRGWVPAVLADRRRHDGTGNGKRPNGNGWRRLD